MSEDKRLQGMGRFLLPNGDSYEAEYSLRLRNEGNLKQYVGSVAASEKAMWEAYESNAGITLLLEGGRKLPGLITDSSKGIGVFKSAGKLE